MNKETKDLSQENDLVKSSETRAWVLDSFRVTANSIGFSEQFREYVSDETSSILTLDSGIAGNTTVISIGTRGQETEPIISMKNLIEKGMLNGAIVRGKVIFILGDEEAATKGESQNNKFATSWLDNGDGTSHLSDYESGRIAHLKTIIDQADSVLEMRQDQLLSSPVLLSASPDIDTKWADVPTVLDGVGSHHNYGGLSQYAQSQGKNAWTYYAPGTNHMGKYRVAEGEWYSIGEDMFMRFLWQNGHIQDHHSFTYPGYKKHQHQRRFTVVGTMGENQEAPEQSISYATNPASILAPVVQSSEEAAVAVDTSGPSDSEGDQVGFYLQERSIDQTVEIALSTELVNSDQLQNIFDALHRHIPYYDCTTWLSTTPFTLPGTAEDPADISSSVEYFTSTAKNYGFNIHIQQVSDGDPTTVRLYLKKDPDYHAKLK